MQTSFARLNRRQSRIVLGLVLVAVLASVAVTLSPIAQGYADGPARHETNDIELYQAIVDRVHDGEAYYPILSEELRTRGYPTASFFNWRTPLPMWLIGVLPSPIFGKVILCLLAGLALLVAFELTAREGGTSQSMLTVLLMVGGLLPCFLGDLYVMPVLWAGALIVISVCALSIDRPNLGVTCGILAVFVRDLAGPFCLLGLGLAVWRRRYREAAYWIIGLGLYGVYFLWHCYEVSHLRTASDLAHAETWIQGGGLPFLLSTVQMNGFLLVLPQWFSAIYFPLALLGFASWSSRQGRTAGYAAVLFVLLFAMVGQPFNQYWGSITAPLLCLGAGRAPLALRDLCRSASVNLVSPATSPSST